MQRFSAFDLQRNVGSVQDAAMQAPVAITHHGRDRLVLLSAAEYDRLKRRDKQAIAIEDTPDDFLAALREPVDDPELAALNHLMDD